jgi:ArsR family transcriptional regulator
MVRFSQADRRRLARCCHALSDDTRLRILERLSAGERCVCELTAALGAGQSRLSFHLKALKDAGLVRDRREGRWMYYSLNSEAVSEARRLLERVAAQPPHPLPVLASSAPRSAQ